METLVSWKQPNFGHNINSPFKKQFCITSLILHAVKKCYTQRHPSRLFVSVHNMQNTGNKRGNGSVNYPFGR